MRRSSFFCTFLFGLLIVGVEHMQAQTLQVALSPAPKVNRTTSGGTATIFFDSDIEDLSIICTEEDPNESITKFNDHQWFVNIDVNKDIEADGICYRNYLLKCSASAEYFLTTEEIAPNQVLYYTITLPNDLEPKLKNQIFQTRIAKIPSIIDKYGVSCAFDSIEKLSHEFSPLSGEQILSINNNLIVLANKSRKDYYLYSSFECREGDISDICISPNDSMLAVASWYGGTISLIDLYNPKNVISLDNYDKVEARPQKMEFSKDSKYLWVYYGSFIYDNVEICKWDIKKEAYYLIPVDNRIKNKILDFCLVEGGLLVDVLGRNNTYFIDENGNLTEINLNNEKTTAISCVNDSLCCISTEKKLSIYKTNDFKRPILSYPLDFERIKYLVGSGNRIAALYTNDTIVVYNAIQPKKEIIQKGWGFDNGFYYKRAIGFNKNGNKLFALDGRELYNLNIYTGNFRVWDWVINLGTQVNNVHGKLCFFKDKIILSDDNVIKILAPSTGFKPGEYAWRGDVGHGHSSHQFGGLVNQKDKLIFCSVGNWDFEKSNGEYIDNVVIYSDYNKNQLGKINGHHRKITSLYYDENENNVFSCSLDSVLSVFNIVTKEQILLNLKFQPTCLIFANGECYIGDSEGRVHTLHDSLLIGATKVSDYELSQIVVDNRGYIISGDVRGNIVVLNSSLDIINKKSFSNAEVTALVSDNNGNLIVGQKDGWIRICDMDNLKIANRKKMGEQISSITLNGIDQIVVCTTKHGYSDTQSSNNTYVLSSKELLLLYELSGVTAPNKLWWLSDYELVGTNGIRFFTWNLPRNIISDLKQMLR